VLRSTTFFASVLGICAWVLPCAPVAAKGVDVVLVLDADSKVSAGFLSALQIELGDAYRVDVAPRTVPAALPARIALATELVESERALATVWIEDGSPQPRSALLYVVGRRAGRALLEVVQAPDTGDLDLPRMLSIKLAELLSQLRSGTLHPLQPQPHPLAPPPAAEPEPPRPRVWGALSLGPRFDVGLGAGWSRFGLGAGLAPELSFGSLRLALGLGIDWYPSLQVRANSSEVSLSEATPRVFLGASWFTPGVAFAFQAGPTWSIMSVTGRTPRGLEHGDTLDELGLSFALSAERSFASTLSLGARLELHVAERRLHFDVNEESVLDRGRLRLSLGIDVTFRTNVTAAP
jgi:hypothetical protein